jgi:hypothetical protein
VRACCLTNVCADELLKLEFTQIDPRDHDRTFAFSVRVTEMEQYLGTPSLVSLLQANSV